MTQRHYLEFQSPKSNSPDKKPTLIIKLFIELIGKLIPKANPDYEKLIEKVQFWQIEIDNNSNETIREIGFDKDRKIIMVMPFKTNMGYWSDNQLTLKDYKQFAPKKITQKDFELNWQKFVKN